MFQKNITKFDKINKVEKYVVTVRKLTSTYHRQLHRGFQKFLKAVITRNLFQQRSQWKLRTSTFQFVTQARGKIINDQMVL